MRESVRLHAVEEVSDVEPCGSGVCGIVRAVEVVEGLAVGLGTLGGGVIGLGVVFETPSWKEGLLGDGFGTPGLWLGGFVGGFLYSPVGGCEGASRLSRGSFR